MRAKVRASMALALAACARCPVALAQGDGSFETPLRLPVPNPFAVAAGRFDADDRLDLAVIDAGTRLTVFFQGPGGRSDWAMKEFPGVGGFHLRAADFTADGLDDLVIASSRSRAYFLASKGDGTFFQRVALSQSDHALWTAAGDFNADGRLDLATANHGAHTVPVYLGRGGGTFVYLKTYLLTDDPVCIEALDYDGDGKLDLLVGIRGGLLPLEGAGDGSFTLRPVITNFAGCYWSIFTADFNRDGLLDLLMPCGVDLNLGNGAFQRTLDANLSMAAIGDLNGDGLQDVAALTPWRAEAVLLDVYPGKADGSFEEPVAKPLSGEVWPSSLIARDLDADGRADLAVADQRSSALIVLWGRSDLRFLNPSLSLEGLGSVRAAAAGDLDLDQKPDVFIPDATDSNVLLYLMPGQADLGVPLTVIDTLQVYTALEVADLDGNGIPDLAGANRSGGQALATFLDSQGKVLSETVRLVGISPSAVAVARLDEGETPDVALACTGSSHVAVIRGLGAGEFSEARAVPTVPQPRDLAAGDLDGDGLTDLAVISTPVAAVHFGAGGGDFAAPVVLTQDTSKHHSDVAVADVTGDGRSDLLVSALQSNGVLLWGGSGRREFEPMKLLRVGASPVSVVAADLNGDGLLDLTTAGSSGQLVSVRLNRGGAGWTPPADYWAGFAPLGHRLADFDGDGALDALVYGGNRVVILPGGRPESAAGRFLRGDADGDGRLAVNDPIAVLGRLFLGGPPLACEDAADADDDGVLAVADPIAALNHLFLGAGPLPAPGPERCGADPTADTLPACARSCT